MKHSTNGASRHHIDGNNTQHLAYLGDDDYFHPEFSTTQNEIDEEHNFAAGSAHFSQKDESRRKSASNVRHRIFPIVSHYTKDAGESRIDQGFMKHEITWKKQFSRPTNIHRWQKKKKEFKKTVLSQLNA